MEPAEAGRCSSHVKRSKGPPWPWGRIATSVVLAGLLTVGVSGTAVAKGPESLTITGPGIADHVVHAENVDREVLTTFMEQSGLWFGIGDLPRPVAEPTASLPEPVTIAWVNGGPPSLGVVERTIVQHVYLLPDGRVLIETPQQATLAGWGESVLGWFEAPASFVETAAQVGVSLESAFGLDADAPESTVWTTAGPFVALLVLLVGWFTVRFRRRESRRWTLDPRTP